MPFTPLAADTTEPSGFTPQSGFVPLDAGPTPQSGFVPLDDPTPLDAEFKRLQEINPSADENMLRALAEKNIAEPKPELVTRQQAISRRRKNYMDAGSSPTQAEQATNFDLSLEDKFTQRHDEIYTPVRGDVGALNSARDQQWRDASMKLSTARDDAAGRANQLKDTIGETPARVATNLAISFGSLLNSIDGYGLSKTAGFEDLLTEDGKRQRDQTLSRIRERNASISGLQSTLPEPTQKFLNASGTLPEQLRTIGNALAEGHIGLIADLGTQSSTQSLAAVASALLFRNAGPAAASMAGGASSAAMEFGNDYAGLVQEGVDPRQAWNMAANRAGIIGLFDAASFGSAGQAMDKVIQGGFSKVVEAAKEVGKETARQAGYGMAGEAIGTAASGRVPRASDVLAEGIGEVFGAPMEAMSTYTRYTNVTPNAPDIASNEAPVRPETAAPATAEVPAATGPEAAQDDFSRFIVQEKADVDARRQRLAERRAAEKVKLQAIEAKLRSAPAQAVEAPSGFVPLESDAGIRSASETIPLSTEGGSENAETSGGVRRLAADAEALPGSDEQGFQKLWGPGDHGMSGVAGELSDVPEGRWAEAGEGSAALAGAAGYEQRILPGEREVVAAPAADFASEILSSDRTAERNADDRGNGTQSGNSADYVPGPFAEPGAGTRASGGEGASAVSEGFTPLHTERPDLEPVGVGEATGRPAPDVAKPFSERDGTGAGADAGRLAQIDEAAHQAATSPLNDLRHPTPAQVKAGNYRKGAVKLHGLEISIENPRGSVRSGTNQDGSTWRTQMQDHYGYIRGVIGRDKDYMDVFIGPRGETEKAFVVDQVDPKTGAFDEHKIVLGADTPEEARAIYLRNYEPGWRGLGAMTEMRIPELRNWLANGKTKAPVALGKRGTVAGRVVYEMPQGEVNAARNARAPGANYVGLIPDNSTAPAKAGELAAKPIRREDVLIPFLKALNVPIYEGRVKGKRLGFYVPKKEAVRLKRKSDLEVAAHELAHLIDDRAPEIRTAWKKDKALADELRAVSDDQTKVYEGFAEFVRLYMTQPDAALAKAPLFSKWFDAFTQRHEYGPAIMKAQADMRSWFEQDALHRAQSKIGRPKELNAALDGIWDRLRQATVDDFHGLYRMERDLKGGIEALGAYETARLTRASHAMTDGAIRFGHPVKQPDGSVRFVGKGLEEILDPVAPELDKFLMYAVGKSAQELMEQGRENLFTPGEIKAMVALEKPAFRKAFQEYQTWNSGVLDFTQAHGAINAQSRAAWARSQYLPFYRAHQPGSMKNMGGAQGNWQGIKKLTGGTDNLRDILGNMIQNAATLIDVAVKNEARAKIAELADEKGGGRYLVKIAPEKRLVKIDGGQVKDSLLQALGLDPTSVRLGRADPEAMKLAQLLEKELPSFVQFWQGATPAGNVMAVLEDGKPVYYEIADPLLYRAVSSFTRPTQHWVTKWLGMPKRIGQATITLTPDFAVANIARDTLSGAVFSRAGFVPVVDSIRGMRSRLLRDPDYREFIANGGGMASYLLDESTMRKHLERFYTRKGINPRLVIDAPDKALYALETIADAFEMSTRLGEYKRAKARGENPRHAAYLAREVSTDFAMKGDSQALGFLYDTVMFLRPAMVSMDRVARGFVHDPNRGAVAAKTGILALASAALFLHNRDIPEYLDLEDWDRDSYWHVFVPTGEGNIHFRYPKIWEIGAISSIAERSMERMLDQDGGAYAQDIARILGNTFHVNLLPQAIAPLYEQATNRNNFTGRMIETPNLQDVQPFLRAKPYTSETMKELGMATRDLPESLQVNPVRTEALLRGYFNTWAMYGLMLSDEAFYGDRMPAKRSDEWPVVRRFYSADPAKHTRYESMYYDMLGEAQRLRGTMRELDRMDRSDLADEKEKSPLSNEARVLQQVDKRLQAIKKEMAAARKDGQSSRDQKLNRLDDLTRERNVLLKQTVMESKKAQEGR